MQWVQPREKGVWTHQWQLNQGVMRGTSCLLKVSFGSLWKRLLHSFRYGSGSYSWSSFRSVFYLVHWVSEAHSFDTFFWYIATSSLQVSLILFIHKYLCCGCCPCLTKLHKRLSVSETRRDLLEKMSQTKLGVWRDEDGREITYVPTLEEKELTLKIEYDLKHVLLWG